MATAQGLGPIILNLVEQNPDCDLEELVARCPQTTWNQVFLALDTLSRLGEVTLRQQGVGRYKIALAPRKLTGNQTLSQHHT